MNVDGKVISIEKSKKVRNKNALTNSTWQGQVKIL
jgi:hypothetical protein